MVEWTFLQGNHITCNQLRPEPSWLSVALVMICIIMYSFCLVVRQRAHVWFGFPVVRTMKILDLFWFGPLFTAAQQLVCMKCNFTLSTCYPYVPLSFVVHDHSSWMNLTRRSRRFGFTLLLRLFSFGGRDNKWMIQITISCINSITSVK